MKPLTLVVLISGKGSNLQAIIDEIRACQLPAVIKAVISNKKNVLGLQRAQQAHIPTHVLEHQAFKERSAYDAALQHLIDQYQPDLVVLAGFMRILTAKFVQHYAQRLLNIHPSLLPKYPGLNTHQRALETGDTEHGASVHFVTAAMDQGPVIIQGVIRIKSDDSPDTLTQRVQKQEHIIYPKAIRWLAERRLQLQNNQVILDGQRLPATGYQWHESL